MATRKTSVSAPEVRSTRRRVKQAHWSGDGAGIGWENNASGGVAHADSVVSKNSNQKGDLHPGTLAFNLSQVQPYALAAGHGEPDAMSDMRSSSTSSLAPLSAGDAGVIVNVISFDGPNCIVPMLAGPGSFPCRLAL